MSPVVRVTAEEREHWGRREKAPGPRGREALWLAASQLVVLLGLLLVGSAVSRPFAEEERGITEGRILNLNALVQPEQARPFLDVFADPQERAFVAERIWLRSTEVDQGDLDNVGALAALRVSAGDLEGRTTPTLDRRLQAAVGEVTDRQGAQRDAADPRVTVRLLSDAQIRQLKPRLVVRLPGAFHGLLWLWLGAVGVAFWAVHLYWRWAGFRGDRKLLPLVCLLTGLGLMVMISLWDPLRDTLYVVRSAQGVIVGCVLLALVSRLDFTGYQVRRWSFLALPAALGLSALLVLFGSGPGTSDARVNLFGVQPVEGIKLLVVVFLAGYFAERWEMLRELKERRGWLARLHRRLRIPKLEYLLPPILAMAVLLGFFFLQRDLGPALILSLLFLSLYGVARGRPTMALVGLATLVAGIVAGFQLGIPRTVTGRIRMWLSPWDNPFTGGDHLAQSLWATASGGWTGSGLGLGQPAFVPAIHTDMVLAALGEEVGFLGLLTVFGLLGLLVWRGLAIARRAPGVFPFFLALGLTLLVSWQVLLIASGVFGLLPLSGVVTPFLSYGRSAMIANFLLVGVLLSISAAPAAPERHRLFHRPTHWLAVVLALALTTVVLRLGYLQVVADEAVMTEPTLALHADGVRRYRYNPRLAEVAERIERGRILDRHGVPLAVNAGDPLSAEERQLLAQLGAPTDPPVTGAERFYPLGGPLFHLLGDLNSHVNWSATNTSFVERDEQVRLQGYDDHAELTPVVQPTGERVTLVKRDYRELVPLYRHRYQPDHPAVRRILERRRDVELSIDARLQLRLAAALARRAEAGAGRGAAVVLDAETGELLASVSVPWPAARPVTSEAGGERLMDRPRYGLYPPGSTFKIVTAMAALRKDPALVDETYTCRSLPGGRAGNRVRGWGRPIRDDPTVRVPHGEVTLEEGIRVSCNAYFAQLATYGIEAPELLETAALAGITVARPNTVEQLQDALPQAAYGQGQVVATPLEMARVAAAVAHQGRLPEVRWVIGEPAGESAARRETPIVQPAQAELLADAMRQVVLTGSGRLLRDTRPPVAGKTGTAEVAGKASHSWFIGFAPAGAAEGTIAFAVVIENAGYGGQAAAEMVGVIVRESQALGYLPAEP